MEKNKIRPITPDEIYQEIPDYVIEGANKCIKDHYLALKKSSHFTQDELIEYISEAYYKANPGTEVVKSQLRAMLFDKHYLDIEPIYRECGWKVNYDKPAYFEDYPANFTFSKA